MEIKFWFGVCQRSKNVNSETPKWYSLFTEEDVKNILDLWNTLSATSSFYDAAIEYRQGVIMEDKRITIIFPVDLWKSLRRLQEEGKIKSIQQATIECVRQYVNQQPEKK